MDEAIQCDRIALIQSGKFLTIDSPQGIIDSYTETLWAVRSNQMHKLLTDLRKINGIKSAFAFGEEHHATIDTSLTIESLHQSLCKLGHKDIRIEKITPSIEDCFMNLQN